MAKVIRYSLTFLGTIELDENEQLTESQIQSLIAEDYYNAGFDIENANDIEYEIEEA